MVCQQIEKGTDPRPFSLTCIAQPHNLLGDAFVGRRAREIYMQAVQMSGFNLGAAQEPMYEWNSATSRSRRETVMVHLYGRLRRERLRITNFGSNIAEILLFDIDPQ